MSRSSVYTVYFLHCADTKQLLYVGRTQNKTERKWYFEKRTGLRTYFSLNKRYSSFEEACLAEVAAILLFQPPFNKNARSGKGAKGTRHTFDARRRISTASSSRIQSAETRLRRSQSLRGKPKSPEHRRNLSISLRAARSKA